MRAHQFRFALGGDVTLDPRQQRLRRFEPVDDIHAGDALAVEDDAPRRREHPLGDADARFLGEFSNDAAPRSTVSPRMSPRSGVPQGKYSCPAQEWRGPISPSKKAPSAERSAGIEKQL